MKINQIILLVALFTASSPVMAYIDPGSGSAIMSAIIGFFVSITLILKTYWYKIKSFFVKSNKGNKNTNEQEKNTITDNE